MTILGLMLLMIEHIFTYLWNGPKTEGDDRTVKFIYVWRFYVVLLTAHVIHVGVVRWQSETGDVSLDAMTISQIVFTLYFGCAGWLLHTRHWEWGALALFCFLWVVSQANVLFNVGASPTVVGFQLSLLIGVSYFYELRTARKVSIITIIVFTTAVFGHEIIKQIDSFVPRPNSPWIDFFMIVLSATHALLIVHIAKYQAELAQQVIAKKNLELIENQEVLEFQAVNLQSALVKAADARVAKSSFFAHMSHELRTPLNAIIGYGELVQEQLQETNGRPETILDTQRIQLSGRHLLKIIESILNLNRIEKNEVNIKLTQIQLGPLLTELEVLLSPLFAEHNNLFEISILDGEDGSEMGGMVQADGQLLLQVLINLVSNATKFTQDGKIQLEVRKKEALVEFLIIDNGIGIDPEFLPYIFEPFSQEGKGLSRKFQGAGLGMAISREMVSQMNGTISAANNKNGGATFEVLLPLFAV